jgi:TRAP-type C4-dicarboxylate transport system permease small subunit
MSAKCAKNTIDRNILYNISFRYQAFCIQGKVMTEPTKTALPHAFYRSIMWLSARLLAAERLAVAGFMFLLTGLILLNVITRYTGMPLYWVDESAIYSVVFLTFIGASAMTRLRLDFAVTMLTERLSERGAHIAKIISTMIVLLFALALLWMCILWLDPVGIARAGFNARDFAGETFNFIYTERTQTLNWPFWILYLIMPVFACCMLVHSTANLLEDIEVVPRASHGDFLHSSMEGLS